MFKKVKNEVINPPMNFYSLFHWNSVDFVMSHFPIIYTYFRQTLNTSKGKLSSVCNGRVPALGLSYTSRSIIQRHWKI